MKYWHELTKGELDKLFKSNITWSEVRKKYKQPDWCKLPEALDALGCWSLIGKDIKISKPRCKKNCDMFREVK